MNEDFLGYQFFANRIVSRFNANAVSLEELTKCGATRALFTSFCSEAGFAAKLSKDFSNGSTLVSGDIPAGAHSKGKLKVLGASIPGGRGCMHTKLVLLDRGSKCRIIVTSANLTRFDWEELHQVVWVYDADLIKSESIGSGTDSRSHSENSFIGGLVSHLKALLTDNDLQEELTYWQSLLSRVKHRDPYFDDIVHLVHSIPTEPSPVNGVGSLTRSLKGWQGGSSGCRVRYAMSSIGKIFPAFLNGFKSAIRCRDFRPSVKSNRFELVWPTYEQGVLTSPGSFNVFYDGSSQSYLTEHLCLHEKDSFFSSRASHAKFITSTREESRTDNAINSADQSSATSSSDHPSEPFRSLEWMYGGSHNFSSAAWGVSGDGRVKCMNFEAGVLIRYDLLRARGIALGNLLDNSSKRESIWIDKIFVPMQRPLRFVEKPGARPWVQKIFHTFSSDTDLKSSCLESQATAESVVRTVTGAATKNVHVGSFSEVIASIVRAKSAKRARHTIAASSHAGAASSHTGAASSHSITLSPKSPKNSQFAILVVPSRAEDILPSDVEAIEFVRNSLAKVLPVWLISSSRVVDIEYSSNTKTCLGLPYGRHLLAFFSSPRAQLPALVLVEVSSDSTDDAEFDGVEVVAGGLCILESPLIKVLIE